MKILAIPGSLRKHSCNHGLLKAATQLAPEGCSIDIFDLIEIPLYNQDLENPLPPAVVALKEKVRAADALLIATPEYNYSIPGVLKNALDWGSRPYGDNVWDNKPLAILGATAGMQGTSRAQYHLRQICVILNLRPLNRPELLVSSARDKFDDQGNLTDPKVRDKIVELLTALIQASH